MLLSEIYKALADENRLRIVNILTHGSFNVQELTSVLETSQSTVSHHLKTLLNADLIESTKEGTWTYYKLPHLNGDRSLSHSVAKNLLDIITQKESTKDTATDNERIQAILDKRREEARRYFESVAPNWKNIREDTIDDSSYLSSLLSGIPRDRSVLELGCGSGEFLKHLLPRQGETIAVDYSLAMLEEAKKNLGELSTSVDLRLGYLEHLPIENERVDYAVAHMVLHHIADPRVALKDTARVLKPGGKLIVADLLRHDKEVMRERYSDLWLGFDTNEFCKWVETAGFNSPEIQLMGPKKEVFLLTATKT